MNERCFNAFGLSGEGRRPILHIWWQRCDRSLPTVESQTAEEAKRLSRTGSCDRYIVEIYTCRLWSCDRRPGVDRQMLASRNLIYFPYLVLICSLQYPEHVSLVSSPAVMPLRVLRSCGSITSSLLLVM